MRRQTKPLLWIVVALAVFITALWQQRAEYAPAGHEPHASVQPARWSRVQQVVSAAERQPLLDTLVLIERGGPFPHDKDGATFSNREGRLPPQPRGYYREYTVPTAGARDRGARRVVQGREGETWYTRDHYRSFVRIDR